MPIAHHGAGEIGSLAEPKTTFWPLADEFRVVIFDARECGLSEGKPPFSHAQWTADVHALREWIGVDQVVIAGGSYGGFIAMEYALAYPRHTRAMVQCDTSPDNSNLERLRKRAQPDPRRDQLGQLGQLQALLGRAHHRPPGPEGPLGRDHPALRLRVRSP
jgi:proline iminopeptidase